MTGIYTRYESPMPTSDLQRIRRHFDRAAETYAEAAVLHAEVERRVLERLDWIKIKPRRMVDIGCGPGRGTALLQAKYPDAECVAVDLSMAMLHQFRNKTPSRIKALSSLLPLRSRPFPLPVCADMSHLPLRDHCADLLYSGISLHWASDPRALFNEFRRVLRPGGLLMFTTVGPDTLKELREAWTRVDNDQTHVNRFPDLHDLGDALLSAGFKDPVTDMELFTLTYDDPLHVLRDLRSIGADTVLTGYRDALTGPKRLKAMTRAYRSLQVDGKVPSTWEIIYGSAWMGEAVAPGALPVAFQSL